MIDKETVQRIKDAADIVEVVGDYVNLTRRGANYMGLCPFHNERTPSFSVSPKRNFCYCFSCHKGGSPVNFIMEKEGVSYHDALLQLAKKYNIHVEETELTDEERARITEREAMLVASEWALQYFHRTLYESEEGRAVGLSYLYGRGVTDEAIRKFMLGYCPDSGQGMLAEARRQGFDIEVMKKIGLVGTSRDGREYDKFHGRVIFPIRNTSGKPVAFGGRDLKGGPAKYINSPETLLYKKSNELYGIFEAKPDIVRQDKVFLMEGYLDVIGSWQSGITNCVASSGTALTDGQIVLLHRFTDKVTLVYDGDAAGIKAAFRGIDMLLSHRLQVNVLLLPDGDDPDSFARKHTPEDFRRYVADNETDIIEFKARVLMNNAGESSQQRTQAVMSVVESIACIPNDVERSLYIQKCSAMMGVDERSVASAVAEKRVSVLENLRKQRRLNDIDRRYPQQSSGESPAPDAAGQPPESAAAPSSPAASAVSPAAPTIAPAPKRHSFFKESPRIPIERELLKYCVRYGFLEVIPVKDENDEDFMMTVLDYVDDELKADSLEFSDPVFRHLFDILLSLTPEFMEARALFAARLDAEIAELRRAGFDEIASRGLAMDEIRKEELRLENHAAGEYARRLTEFCRDWPGNYLSSHEEDEIRQTATALLCERHQLSAIYFRDGQHVETEQDKLAELVPRALAELRNEVLNQRIRTLHASISEAQQSGDAEQLRSLMVDLQKTMLMRSRIASRDLGDRIISPR